MSHRAARFVQPIRSEATFVFPLARSRARSMWQRGPDVLRHTFATR